MTDDTTPAPDSTLNQQVPKALRELMTSGDQPLKVTRQHLVVRASVVLQSLVVIVLVAVLWMLTDDLGFLDNVIGTVWQWILGIGLALALVRLIVEFVGWRFERLVITEQKIMHIEGIVNRRVRSSPLSEINQLDVEQGLLGRVLNYGTLMVENAASGNREPLEGLGSVPAPMELYRVISENARRQRMIEGGAHPDAFGN